MCPGNKWSAVAGTIILGKVQKVKTSSLLEFVFDRVIWLTPSLWNYQPSHRTDGIVWFLSHPWSLCSHNYLRYWGFFFPHRRWMSVDHVKIYVQHLSLCVWLLRDQSPHWKRAAAAGRKSRRCSIICTTRLCLTWRISLLDGIEQVFYFQMRGLHFCTLPTQRFERSAQIIESDFFKLVNSIQFY